MEEGRAEGQTERGVCGERAPAKTRESEGERESSEAIPSASTQLSFSGNLFFPLHTPLYVCIII